MELDWRWRSFGALAGIEVHEIIDLRESVFVVEQNCAYQEADEYDVLAEHLFGRDQGQQLIAYARVLPANTKYPEPSIGRVVVARFVRGSNLGRELIRRSVEYCNEKFSASNIKLSAQVHMSDFYTEFGFVPASEPYDDMGIEHIDMCLNVGMSESNFEH